MPSACRSTMASCRRLEVGFDLCMPMCIGLGAQRHMYCHASRSDCEMWRDGPRRCVVRILNFAGPFQAGTAAAAGGRHRINGSYWWPCLCRCDVRRHCLGLPMQKEAQCCRIQCGLLNGSAGAEPLQVHKELQRWLLSQVKRPIPERDAETNASKERPLRQIQTDTETGGGTGGGTGAWTGEETSTNTGISRNRHLTQRTMRILGIMTQLRQIDTS